MYLHFTGHYISCKKMLSCRSGREDFLPFSWCKKIFQFLWLLPRSALASPIRVCMSCHGWQNVRALGSATPKCVHSHSFSSSLPLSSVPFGEHQGLTHAEGKISTQVILSVACFRRYEISHHEFWQWNLWMQVAKCVATPCQGIASWFVCWVKRQPLFR